MNETIEYFKNGKIKTKGLMVSGKKKGRWLIFTSDGFVFKEENYKNNLLHGIVRRWYKNGILALECNYISGKYSGPWVEYYENGTKKEEGYYKDDEYLILNYWDENGRQILANGDGYKIEKYGTEESDIYKQYYSNSKLLKEEKLSDLKIVR